jgi:ABC-type transporter MlaC component
MSAKRTAEPSPESVARANRQRLAQEEGARAMADLEKQSSEIRKNMQRLRTLREAKLAEEIGRTSSPQPAKKKRRKQLAR